MISEQALLDPNAKDHLRLHGHNNSRSDSVLHSLLYGFRAINGSSNSGKAAVPAPMGTSDLTWRS
jgi:hypothetical protein